MMDETLARYLSQAIAVCLDTTGRAADSVSFLLQGSLRGRADVQSLRADERMRAAWNDLDKAAEEGGYAIAFIVVRQKEGLCPINQAKKKTGFDYWMGPPTSILFQGTARLEVTGILSEKQSTSSRLARKILQTKTSDDTKLPAYAMVVNFCELIVKSKKRKVR